MYLSHACKAEILEDKMKTKSLLITLILVLIAGLLTGCGSITTGTGNGAGDPIKASGVIEAEEVKIASELPGRIANIQVTEGDSVKGGDLLVTLEDDLLLNQQTQTQAASDAAQAQLASAQAAEDAAAASLQAAEANLDAAKDHYQLVLSQVQEQEGEDRVVDWNESTPAQFDLPAWYFQQPENITAAQNLVDQIHNSYQEELDNYQETAADVGGEEFIQAEERLADALADFEIADTLRDRRVGSTGSQEIRDLIDTIYDSADTELEAAQTDYDQLLSDPEYDEILEARAKVSVARERYDLARDYLFSLYSGEYALEVQSAQAMVDQADAGVLQAQAQIALAESERKTAETAVARAEAEMESVTLQLEKLKLYSPLSGVVLTRTVESGEVISAGYTVLTIGNLDKLTVTVYLPEDRYGQIALGEKAELTIDSYPDDTFEAEVVWISDQAEYTPRNVQTQEERQNTVYAVKLAIKSNNILKPGMPADVVFTP
jgi:multidrug resistance efflux pump